MKIYPPLKKALKKLSIFLPCVGALFIKSSSAFAAEKVIKVAVIDNLKYEKLSTERYVTDYFEGLEVATAAAKRKDIHFETKHFYFDKRPLAIFQAADEAKSWNPDVIIGPRFSDLLLLLKDKISNVMVVSPLATATAVYSLPSNFYTMAPPNAWYGKAMKNFVEKNMPGRAIQPIIEVDCKYCVDWGNQFQDVIAASQSKIEIRKRQMFLSKDVETVDISSLIQNSESSDLFLIPNRSYTSGTLMGRISNHFKKDNLVFLGADGWGDWTASYTGKYQTKFKYSGYYLNPFPLEGSSRELNDFKAQYKAQLGKTPTATISLISYKTLSAIAEAYAQGNSSGSNRERVLDGFKKLTTTNIDYFRPQTFAVFEVNQSGEQLKEFISAK